MDLTNAGGDRYFVTFLAQKSLPENYHVISYAWVTNIRIGYFRIAWRKFSILPGLIINPILLYVQPCVLIFHVSDLIIF